MDNKNIGANELIKGGMHLNIGELVNFLSILLKRLNFKNWRDGDSFLGIHSADNIFIVKHNSELS